MTAPESVACKVPHYPYPAVEKFSDSVLSAERCIQSQGLTTEHQPEVKSYRQKWESVDLIFRINVASLKVKIMNLRVMK
ncbi:MAG: hypothetical protein DMG41_12000 [Acidobacteria bacterium]|nr:MAG: hypothetical protein DMG41_12000 [Acidobacteriota bacterium]